MAIRFPVVRSRYWVQRTALGAADVPEVNSNAHRASTSGSADAALASRSATQRGQAASSARSSDSPGDGRVVAVGEAIRDEDAAGAGPPCRWPHRAGPGAAVR